MEELNLVATAAFGVEKIVVRELAELGYDNARVEDGRVHFKGDLDAICKTNLWLRCAERVQVVVGEFKAVDFDELFDQTKELEWERWLPVDAKFPVNARVVRSFITSGPNTQKMLKRAIVERMRKIYSRHWFAETGTEYQVDCHILGDRVLLTLDTTGDGLHKRGYRRMVSTAPLRETIAAALVKLSYWNNDRLLVDPFCGSGTIPIEAAMVGRNLAPGRNRSFAAEDWVQIEKKKWTEARLAAREEEKPHMRFRIVARDRDKRIVKAAKQNAKEAGVMSDILFEPKEFYTFPTDHDFGVMICNPPYGQRIGDRNEVQQLHSDMKELLVPLDTWSLYILTGAEGFERQFGRKADRRRKLFNARIPCTYYQYLGPRPSDSDIENLKDWDDPNPVVTDDSDLDDGTDSSPSETKSKPASPWDQAVERKRNS